MKIYGKIHQILKRERIISIVINSRLEYFHMTNRFMKDFKAYLFKKPYVFMEVEDKYVIHNYHKCREINHFIKIVQPTRKGNEIYYDISVIQEGVKSLINKNYSQKYSRHIYYACYIFYCIFMVFIRFQYNNTYFLSL